MTRTSRVEIFASWETLVEASAERMATALSSAIQKRGRALAALSGGATPAPIYVRLAQHDLPWAKVTLTLTDERWAPDASPDSNARLVRETLLTGEAAAARLLPLKRDNDADPARASAQASAALGGETLDLALLGMGADGHFASLFPGSPALSLGLSAEAPACIAAPAGSPAPVQPRLSLSLSFLAGAGVRMLVIRGHEKLEVLERAAAGQGQLPVSVLLDRGAPDVLWAP